MLCTRDRSRFDVHNLIFLFAQVGRLDSEKAAAIRLSGDNILEEHCYFENNDGKVVIHCLPDSVTVRRVPRVPTLKNLLTCGQFKFLNGKQISPGQVRTHV